MSEPQRVCWAKVTRVGGTRVRLEAEDGAAVLDRELTPDEVVDLAASWYAHRNLGLSDEQVYADLRALPKIDLTPLVGAWVCVRGLPSGRAGFPTPRELARGLEQSLVPFEIPPSPVLSWPIDQDAAEVSVQKGGKLRWCHDGKPVLRGTPECGVETPDDRVWIVVRRGEVGVRRVALEKLSTLQGVLSWLLEIGQEVREGRASAQKLFRAMQFLDELRDDESPPTEDEDGGEDE